jgi:hypothetical protein
MKDHPHHTKTRFRTHVSYSLLIGGADRLTISSMLVAANTIRILLATDNHIGYMERDPIRGEDSINTFKEILQMAVKNDVSFSSFYAITN